MGDNRPTSAECELVYRHCNRNLSGVWKTVQLTDVDVNRVSGGMTNFLYHCSLIDGNESSGSEPRDVLVRVYGPSHRDTDKQGGRLEEFLPSKPITAFQMKDEKISAVIARKIAAIQRLSVDHLVSKNQNWLLDRYSEYIDYIDSIRRPPDLLDALESTRSIADEMLSIDFHSEIAFLADLFSRIESPKVFSHNDLHQNNILILSDNERHPDLHDRIVLIDFEYCAYNFRLFDIGNHISEFCFDYNYDQYPNFKASLDWFPSEERQRSFIKYYVQELGHFFSGQSHNGCDKADILKGDLDKKIEELMDELQPSLMGSNLLWALWAIKSACNSKISFGYWEMAKMKWEIYCLCKEQYYRRLRLRESVRKIA